MSASGDGGNEGHVRTVARATPAAPAYVSLPVRTRRRTRGGAAARSFAVEIEVVTPILGGASRTRDIDAIEIIRPATVRGHLRFWWRTLRGHEFTSAEQMYRAEGQLWGRAATDTGGRSVVDVWVDVERCGPIDGSKIHLAKTPGAYALWPAREERRSNAPPAPRRMPGTRFRITLTVSPDRAAELHDVVRAWLLFGGYGGRTRRGLGGFTVLRGAGAWLPVQATREGFASLFGRDVFAIQASADVPAGETPWLAGAALHVGREETDALRAWTIALDWLKEFRQGTSGEPRNRAREPGTGKQQPERPSISNWPEADKIRHLKRKVAEHRPRHNATPAWPRAGFGLPIMGQFQTRARNGGCLDEPDSFELRWRSRNTEHDRLASPLIIKALPLADGTFVPCALWLNRNVPSDGEVGLARPKRGQPQEKEVDPASAAPFDRIVAPGDTPCFSALSGRTSLREAFLDWLHASHGTTVVAS